MQAIRNFLSGKGCPVETWDDAQCRDVAKALGFKIAASAHLKEGHVTKSGKTVTYLVAKTSGRDAWFALNDGESLSPEGLAIGEALVEAISNVLKD